MNQEHLSRVTTKIGGFICDFVNERLRYNMCFTAEELREYVLAQDSSIAPASPDRILRQLRRSGELNYIVVDRRNSLYQPLQVQA